MRRTSAAVALGRVGWWCLVGMGLAGLGPRSAYAQEPAAGDTTATEGAALRVFFDCNGPACDDDFYRREIPYVNYTRNREDADVHLLITSEQTGSGGRRFSLEFLGRGRFMGLDDELSVTIQPNIVEEEVLSEVARTVQAGLVRYIARTTFAERLRFEFDEPEGGMGQAAATPEDDPWNFWTFEVEGRGFFEFADRQDFLFANAQLSADRITEDVKLQFSVSGSYSESNFDTSDTTTVTSITRGYRGNASLVWSLGGKAGLGIQFGATHSTFSNEDLTIRVAPAFEYNLFPFADSNRRQLRLIYSVGTTYLNYDEETVFLELAETVPDHRLGAALEVRQPWGSSRASFQVVQHLNDLARHRIRFDGGIDLRLFRGFTVDFNLGLARVRDQINLPAGDATDDEILTRQRELATGFETDFSFGFSYTFGSIFSNVVNPRFSGRNGFFLRSF